MTYAEQKTKLTGGTHKTLRINEDLNQWIEAEREKLGLSYGTFIKSILTQVKNSKGE